MTGPIPEDYHVISFDCYGTLVDWKTAMLGYLHPLVLKHDIHIVDDFLLEFFAANETVEQSNGRSYRDVLTSILHKLGQRLAFTPTNDDCAGFVTCIAEAPVFEDTIDSLARLRERFDLAILSNTDRDLLELTQNNLGDFFAEAAVAGEVNTYKPNVKMFETLQETVGRNSIILHVAQSLYHDIKPAMSMGIDCVWIDRAQGKADMTPETRVQAKWSFKSLTEFVRVFLNG